jgi:hypothetical protein
MTDISNQLLKRMIKLNLHNACNINCMVYCENYYKAWEFVK